MSIPQLPVFNTDGYEINPSATKINSLVDAINGLQDAPAPRVIVTAAYDPQSASNHFFVADRAYNIVGIRHVRTVAGTDGGAVTVAINKCVGTESPGDGFRITASATLSLKGAINTSETVSLSSTPNYKVLAVGDRLALYFSGVLTAAVGLTQVLLEPI